MQAQIQPRPQHTLRICSLANSRIKNVVKLRRRSHRDESTLMLIEGYREILRAVDNKHFPHEIFYCPDLFQGENDQALIQRCMDAHADPFECSVEVFNKISYRDRPDGLLAVASQVRRSLADVKVPDNALVLVMESIEKPGNLGTILRSSDAAGVHAVIVCDRCTDINNPNVVRASIGTIFSLPIVEATTGEALAWLRAGKIQILAATPHAPQPYNDANMQRATAIVVGSEQYGLSETWMKEADVQVRIPMLGQADSLNVASAATILLYESVRQRGLQGTDCR